MTGFSKKLALSAAAVALAFSAMPAMAGGSVHVGYYSGGGYYYPAGYSHHGHYRHHGYYRGHHRYRGHHHHGGGKGAAIALGVIGGVIILNELAEERAARERERAYYEARYYDRYDPYARRAAPYPEDRAYDPGPQDGNLSDEELDGGPGPIRISPEAAFDACISHARSALAERGFVLSAPYEPDTAEDLGGSWKMTANVMAQRGGESWTRALYCEADDNRVYLLELI